jgi:hypothetical protein
MGHEVSQEARGKISANNIGKTAGPKHYLWGKKRSPETKAKISASKSTITGSARGEIARKSHLTNNDIISIRSRFRPGKNGNSNSVALAKEFCVNKSSILRIITRQTWSHVAA